MATMATAVRDTGRDNLTAVAARSVPVTKPLPLPTPPNSISPALPPHGLKAQLQRAKLEPIDSDLDLHDAQDGRVQFDHTDNPSPVGSPPYDSTGAITPAMLGKYHLPEILLNHGPLAIRHIMGYLTTSVPGFAGIPPAKARRLVVGALEGRGSGGEGGGLDGDVEFEKVGWGRWSARRRGQPAREAGEQCLPGGAPSPYMSGIPIAKNVGWVPDRSRLGVSASSEGNSAAFSHDDRDITMMEHEADKMSMDGSASASCSEAPDDDIVMNDDPEDVTDDEDWAAMGAAALRAASYSNTAAVHPGGNFSSSGVYPASGGMRSFSAGMARPPQLHDVDLSALGTASDAQEREAIEALLRLGSV
ncbi:Protein STB3 [Pleurostoma richardsiae]|uniref:Protein STB3 n=1 Tax=Pleurostoma richardsiae TaxID=41990 RepID=A0AA38VVK9_9PEZI|nr:Protein STB3 [Pleurostoma richardsiae]